MTTMTRAGSGFPLDPRRAVAFALAILALAMTGCGGYQLRGKVVQGDFSGVSIVSANDPRLDQPGLGGAMIRLETDPEHIRRSIAGEVTSDTDGNFAIPVDEFGAGFLMYDAGITARRRGFASATSIFRLPDRGKRVLITLTPGDDTFTDPYADDPYELYRRFNR